MDIRILTQWATIITVRWIIASIYFSHETLQVMSTTVDTEDTMVVVVMVDIMAAAVGTIMRVMEVIIMGVTGVIMEEVDMEGTMEVDMVGIMAVAEDMVDTVAEAMADTTEGTDTILVVLVLAITDSPLSFRY